MYLHAISNINHEIARRHSPGIPYQYAYDAHAHRGTNWGTDDTDALIYNSRYEVNDNTIAEKAVTYNMASGFFLEERTDAWGEVTGRSEKEIHNMEHFVVPGNANMDMLFVSGSSADNNVYIDSRVDSLAFSGEGGNDSLYISGEVQFAELIGGPGYDELTIKQTPFIVEDVHKSERDNGEVLLAVELTDISQSKDNAIVVGNDWEAIKVGQITYTFDDLFSRYREDIKDRSGRTTLVNNMTGSFKNENFFGFNGRDNITGHEGADHFILNRGGTGARGQHADRILDFDKSEQDKILIDASAFRTNVDEANVCIVRNRDERRNALKDDDHEFVYDQRNGQLLWNQNGAANGHGNGLIADMEAESQLNLVQADFQFI